ncbi:type II toxin-antitoxin system VapC family toxin [Sphingomonas sp. DG1-23]|uniref:type II toxin-antitoxin system VapC family toxin n=1 Tax=Sphingomonas sp. DG1-23 TaxID=3068316 RepID=UPI00273D7DF4|nr:type II toxin-antitoxin system VapC family toxin [Sphingomonas sp. DG1-23]MDP5279148.1 type II toxin-antitoxin system VapC family toxin [Sphingomonas sp. DG1-23]
MRLLLDTHALIWWWADSKAIQGTDAAQAIAGGGDIFVSAATAWEIATKHRLGKLDPGPALDRFEESLVRSGFVPLQIEIAHALRAGGYAIPNADPFDRMLAAQAELEDLTLVSRDPAFAAFPCRILW